MAMTTALRPKTFKNLQLNAGVFLVDFDYSSATDATSLAALISTALEDDTKLLGATTGGGTFVCTPEERQIEADGMRYPVIGSTVYDSWDIRLTGTMKEITADNLKRVIGTADITDAEGGKMHTIKVRTNVEEGDYIDNLVWVGDTSEGYMLIDLENVLNVAGMNMTFADKNEGTLPFEFRAHKGMDAVGDDNADAPVTIMMFDK